MDTSEKVIESITYYNQVSDLYRKISESRSSYLQAVDNEIVKRFSGKVNSMLDVGAGDGIRGIYLHQCLMVTHTVLVEESSGMFEKIEMIAGIEPVNTSIIDFQTNERFDLIVCLWNVFGHIHPMKARIAALSKMRDLLSSQGTIAIDFNNRYNISHYGRGQVFLNRFRTLFMQEAGRFPLSMGNQKSYVYIHNHHEIMTLVSDSGLRVNEELVIDYKTGTLVGNRNDGQFLFFLSR